MAEAKTHTLHILDSTGDTTLTWDPLTKESIDTAIAAFEKEVGEHKSLAYKTEVDLTTGEPMHEKITAFDPEATVITITPQYQGG